MIQKQPQQIRVLAIAPSSRGFGFAVLEGEQKLVDWGVKSVEENKNARSLAKVDELISRYRPTVITLQNQKDSRRSARIQSLSRQITTLASKRKVKVKLISNKQLRRCFFADGKGTKQAVAELLAARFPEELGHRLPPKRRPWMSEDYRMDIFDAVALGFIPSKEKRNRERARQPVNSKSSVATSREQGNTLASSEFWPELSERDATGE